MIYALNAIATGKVQDLPYSKKRPMRSALDKVKFEGEMYLTKTGFVEDEQEYKDHGGPDKAVCLYSKKNYRLWADDLSELPNYAMFGENLTAIDLDEQDVYFGNQYQLGEAILEVSEIREPCWKIQEKYQIKDLAKRMSQSCKTGFYFRVIQEGFVHETSNLKLIKTAEPETALSVHELNDIYYNDKFNITRLKYAINNPYLTEKRKAKLEKFLSRAEAKATK
ncbi:MOSC domain-containing protein [Staphylococcus gallinarum]|uniref:MOSC domain-containing protein n=1 Tax=Staphylococcus gallinarum TaxID=1293 RepID=UPI000D1C5BEE|nr:MOSC domain-containing protein [Staphylococcus gallinarum]MBU7217095.1 MOSC domain-containing protein [Staphylococcus gallinarum]MCD8792688.1 MOSC domain-containing protein [Staphylococcus gallinarum]MCD8844883.1 MOSC domain-containing protein [Staphylococcus gallinarum]MCD8918562.1 MOSC domain-containing protein [Staphylococcus gallinarum]PTE33277.1 MOSC domain-containing protein [Staphylococcus gallinarum]